MINREKKLYWLPPKGFGRFFLSSSDDDFKEKHPVGYWFVVALGISALVGPMFLYGLYVNPAVSLASIGGTFLIGIGLFNFVSILLDQYLGHLISIISFLIGGILIAIDLNLF